MNSLVDTTHQFGSRRAVSALNTGLSVADVQRLRHAFGPNLLPHPPRLASWRHLLAQFVHFFAVMLWIAGGLAIVAGMPQLGLAIFVVIVLNGLFAFL